MPNQSSKEGKKHVKSKVTQKRKVASPSKLRDTRDKTRKNEFGGRSKAPSANRLPRVAQLQKRQSKTSAQENAQPYYMGKDGEILSGQSPLSPLQAAQVSSQEEDEDRSPAPESEETREEPSISNVFHSFWVTVSRLFNTPATSSVDVIDEDTLAVESAPLQSSSAEDQRPGSSNDRRSKVLGNPTGPYDPRRPGLGRSVSQTSGPLTRESWRRRQDADTFSASGAGFNSKPDRKPRLSKEEMLAKRERRVKKCGSPVDSKKFRVVLSKFQNVLKEESKRLGVEPRVAAQGLSRAKSLVIDPSGGAHASSRPSSYGPKSLSSLHLQGNDLNKANVRVSSYVSRRRNALAARPDAVSDRPASSLTSEAPVVQEALEALARSKSTQIALANMQRFRGVNVKSNESQCDPSTSPCKAEVRMPGQMSSCQTEADLKEASVQFPSSSSSNRGTVQSDAEISELSFGM